MSSELRAFEEAAPFIADRIRRMVQERGTCDLVLAGGRTPRGVYAELAGQAEAIPWERLRWFWGDERFVPHDHPASNTRMARETLLDRVPVTEDYVFPIPVNAPSAEEAARAYERTLRGLFPGAAFPAFDLVLLGIGADGHTASLFPGGPECEERTRWCLASRAPEDAAIRDRITLTLPVLNAARAVAFLLAGEDKRGVLQGMLQAVLDSQAPRAPRPSPEEAPRAAAMLPAQQVRPAGEVLYFTDLRL